MFPPSRRQTLLAGKIPKGFYAVRATANGNCLYNATSVALFGNESRSAELRLASVCHAVDHYDHYVDMVNIEARVIGYICPLVSV